MAKTKGTIVSAQICKCSDDYESNNEYYQAGIHDLLFICQYAVLNDHKTIDKIKQSPKELKLMSSQCEYDFDISKMQFILSIDEENGIVFHIPVTKMNINVIHHLDRVNNNCIKETITIVTADIDTDNTNGEFELIITDNVQSDLISGIENNDKRKYKTIYFNRIISEEEAIQWWKDKYSRSGEDGVDQWYADDDLHETNLWLKAGNYRSYIHSDMDITDAWSFMYTGDINPKSKEE